MDTKEIIIKPSRDYLKKENEGFSEHELKIQRETAKYNNVFLKPDTTEGELLMVYSTILEACEKVVNYRERLCCELHFDVDEIFDFLKDKNGEKMMKNDVLFDHIK